VLVCSWGAGLALCAIAAAIVIYMGYRGIQYLRPSLIFTRPQISESSGAAVSGGLLDPLLGTLLLSRGVPMLLGGDELGRTQGGNNNAYCQDNPTSWVDWDNADAGLTAFTRRIIEFRRAHPALRRGRYLSDPGYVVWFTPEGRPMTQADWQSPGLKSVAVFVDGTVAPDHDARGRPMLDDDVLVLVNGSAQPVTFTIPDAGKGRSWRVEIDSFDLGADVSAPTDPVDQGDLSCLVDGSDPIAVGPRAFVLLLALPGAAS